jgi:hypothetical protein
MINQSITVINKSGKVVSTSKHLVSVWKEAKAAYQSRKAEIKASRHAEHRERDTRRAIENLSLSEEHQPNRTEHYTKDHIKRSRTTSRRKSIQPPLERGHTDPTHLNGAVYAHQTRRRSLDDPHPGIVRHSTEPLRPNSAGSYDEHLAYGEMPPPLPLRPVDNEIELRGKMSKLNQLLDEANCLQYTATSMIAHLQKNPDALAAVALTLAEISAMVTKVAPSALTGMKVAFPAVVALLASPEFLIAGGVAVGVTVVMLGGYKIIKRIKSGKTGVEAHANGDDATELRELEGDLSHIEVWRRGVAGSVPEVDNATSVEGEFITPGAERRLIDEGVLDPRQVKPLRRAKSERSHRSHRRRDDSRADAESVRSERTSGSKHRHHRSGASRLGEEESVRSGSSSKAGKPKKRSVGGLRMLFSRRRSNS